MHSTMTLYHKLYKIISFWQHSSFIMAISPITSTLLEVDIGFQLHAQIDLATAYRFCI